MSDEYGLNCDAWQPDNETALRYGCIRIQDGIHEDLDADYLTNPGLRLLNDEGHRSVGILPLIRIEKSTGRIVVDTDGATNGAPFPGPDETAVSGGYRFGATGGSGGQIRIQCAKPGVGLMDLADQGVYDSVASQFLNVWLLWVSPLVRGMGDPSKADQALTLYAALEARVAALEGGCE